MIGDCPEAEVDIAGKTIKCLIDTGSQVSTVTESCYKCHLSSLPLETLEGLRLTAANGIEIPYVGYFSTDVNVLGHCFHNVGILVVKDTELLFVKVLNKVKEQVL